MSGVGDFPTADFSMGAYKSVVPVCDGQAKGGVGKEPFNLERE
jgi:hypothetical protein